MREVRAEADPDLAARAWGIEFVVQIDGAALPCGCGSCTVESLGERAGFVGRHCEAASPAPLAFQSLPRSTFWAAAGSRATMRAGPIGTKRPCRGLSRSGTTTAAAQTSNLEGTYALIFRCFHALAGSHDSGSVSRASRRFRSLAHLRGTSRSPLRTWIVGG